MLVTPSPIVTLVRFVFPRNTPDSMLVTVSPMTTVSALDMFGIRLPVNYPTISSDQSGIPLASV